MITAIDVLQAIAHEDAIESMAKEHAAKLLVRWRQGGKSDEEILREKLTECGWRFDSQRNLWRHPAVPGYSAPANLGVLAHIIAKTAIKEVLKKRS